MALFITFCFKQYSFYLARTYTLRCCGYGNKVIRVRVTNLNRTIDQIVELMDDRLHVVKTRNISRKIEGIFMDAKHIVFSYSYTNDTTSIFQIFNTELAIEHVISLGQNLNTDLPFYMPSSVFKPYLNVS